jgi:phosphonate transport system ATP-binding protein
MAAPTSAAAPRPATVPPPAIVVAGLVKRYGTRTVLAGIDLAVGEGEAVALLGANGAGKSTLLRCLVGLARADAGRIVIRGTDIGAARGRALRRLRAGIGFVFQKHQLVPRLSALSNVLHGALGRSPDPRLWLQATAPRPWRMEALACLAEVGLADLAGQRCERLSGGQSQRVAIARALMQRPSLLLADEPAASLDPRAGVEVMQRLAAVARERGLPVVFTSHQLEHAVRFADRVVALKAGRIALDRPAGRCRADELAALYADR